MLLRSAIVASAALICGVVSASPGHADTYYVAASGTSTTCSSSAPCADIATAMDLTSTGDTIACQGRPRPSFINIVHSITIDCSGVHAGVGASFIVGHSYTTTSDGNLVGVLINIPAGPNEQRIVRLRGLTIEGSNGVGISFYDRGIDIQAAAAVYIEDCVISNLRKQGIFDHRTGGQTKLFIKDTVVNNAAGAGIVAVSAAPNVTVLDNVTSENNAYGMAVGTGNNVVIKNSTFSGNSVVGVEGDAGSHVVVSNSTISHNNIGVQSSSSVRIQSNQISFNNTAFSGLAATLGLNSYNQNVSMGTTPSVVTGAPADIGP